MFYRITFCSFLQAVQDIIFYEVALLIEHFWDHSKLPNKLSNYRPPNQTVIHKESNVSWIAIIKANKKSRADKNAGSHVPVLIQFKYVCST